MRFFFFVISLVLLSSTNLFAQDSLNMAVVGHLTYNQDLSDVRACVINGNEYALVGARNGFSIVDLADPTDPTQVFFLPGNNSTWRDPFEWNEHMYGVTEGGGGMAIIDMSYLPDSTNLNWTTYSGSTYAFSKAHNIFIDENGYAYIFGADNGEGGAIILDLNQDPMNPVEVGRFNDYYIHDGFVRGDTLWAAAVYEGFVSVIDVSDKANPTVLASFNTPSDFSHNVWMSDDNNYAFTTDEVSHGYIASYDVSDLQNITQLDGYQSYPGTGVIPHNTHYINGFLVNSNYTSGVTVLDAQHPNNLIEVGFYDTSPNFDGNGYDGCWGAWPYLPSGHILASDVQTGLYVLSFDYTSACYLEGNVTDINTSTPLNSVQVKILSTTVEDATDLIGDYATGYPTAGTFDVEFSKAGYITETISNVSLANGVLTTLDVQLTPDVPFSLQGTVLDAATNDSIPNAFVTITNNNFTFDIQADASGKFTIPSFFSGNYEIIAGQWGYITRCDDDLITDNTGNLTISLEKGVYDDFSFDFGWTVTGDASTGDWERDEPVGTDYQGAVCNPDFDVDGDCLDQAYITGNGGGSAGDDDIDGGFTRLTSPIFDLTDYWTPHIHYYRWFFNDGGSQGSTLNDEMTVMLDNGQTTVVLETITASSPNNGMWTHKSFKVPELLQPTAQMQLIVEIADISPGHLVEGGLDHFFVADSFNISVQEGRLEEQLKVWPNPFSNKLFVELKNTEADLINITDITGRIVYQTPVNQSDKLIEIEPNLSAGVYILNAYYNGNAIQSRKLIQY